MQDIIDMLLEKKKSLREEIEREFEARNSKIDALLDLAGYVPPVEEIADEAADETETEGEENSAAALY